MRNQSILAVLLGTAIVLGAGLTAPAMAANASEASTSTTTTTSSADTADRVDGDMIVVPGITDAPTAPAKAANGRLRATAVTVHTIYASVASVTNSTADDNVSGLDQTSVQTLVAAMDKYWSAESNGHVRIQFGGYETRSLGQATCAGTNAALAADASAAFGGSFANYAWSGTNRHLLVLAKESCGSTPVAFATVGGSGGEIFSGYGTSTAFSVPATVHEFGHNLGFDHADASICTNTASFDAKIASFTFASTVCPTQEYGDYLDIMGFTIASGLPHLSSIQRINAGYMTDYQALTSGTSSVTLTALDGAATGTRALKITDPNDGGVYYVEYRTSSGADATSGEFRYPKYCNAAVGDGYVLCGSTGSSSTGEVRILRELPFTDGYSTWSGTTVVAVGPVAGANVKTRDLHLDAGESFTDVNGGFTVSVGSLSPSAGAAVTVTFGGTAPVAKPVAAPAPVAATPTTTTPVTSSPVTTKKAAATTIAVTLDHGSVQTYGKAPRVTATARLARVNGAYPQGRVAFILDGKQTLATVRASTSGVAGYTLPVSIAGGKHKITARFTPSSAVYGSSISSARGLIVRKAVATTTIGLHTASIKRSKHESVVVMVRAAGVAAPTGTLVAYANGKKLKSYSLTASKHGRVTIALPTFAKKGTVRITVTYAGNGNVAADASPVARLKVTK
ncbi:Ig-like domain repeat protein [Glaciihabitans sp. dw_435]|uniref:Ig-like domain repeat protein n=1 Tax=Glaciihabitans sp. dw_435 TaxID=2720081 RepID=UPI001BD484F9|nr:Ig-like domain repeat protein [Glaciihabitans sp. dw_435]